MKKFFTRHFIKKAKMNRRQTPQDAQHMLMALQHGQRLFKIYFVILFCWGWEDSQNETVLWQRKVGDSSSADGATKIHTSWGFSYVFILVFHHFNDCVVNSERMGEGRKLHFYVLLHRILFWHVFGMFSEWWPAMTLTGELHFWQTNACWTQRNEIYCWCLDEYTVSLY